MSTYRQQMQSELDQLEELTRREWHDLLTRFEGRDLSSLERTWARVEAWMREGAAAELAPFSSIDVCGIIQLFAVARMQLNVIRLFDQLQQPPPAVLPLHLAA